MIILDKPFRILYKVLFIFSITFIATLFLVRIAFNSLDWYDNGFDRHKVYQAKYYIGGYAEELPFTRIQLSEIASDIINYFNSKEEFLDIKKQNLNGEFVDVFNQREIDHMKDVKNLLEFLYRTQEGLIIYVMLVFTIGFFMSGGGFARQIISLINNSGDNINECIYKALSLFSFIKLKGSSKFAGNCTGFGSFKPSSTIFFSGSYIFNSFNLNLKIFFNNYVSI